MSTRLPVTCLAALMLVACEPSLGNPPSLVTGTRVLAVRGTPPEAKAGAMVSFDLLVASPSGTVSSPPADWGFCTVPTPPSDNNIVANGCLQDSGIAGFGGPAASEQTALPADTCAIYGPDVPMAMAGQPPQQAPAPDITGGFYQPVRVTFTGLSVDGAASFGLERINCPLANASVDVSLAFSKSYTLNNNPVLQTVTGAAGGSTTTVYAPEGSPVPLTVSHGAQVTFVGSWSASSAESFPVYDLTTFMLDTQRESLRLSWFASAGQFAADITGVSATDTATSTSNVWTAPSSPGVVHFWGVLRDNRGGTDFGSFDVTVQ